MPDDRPVLKVCGITRLADMRGAEAAGADFCGLITEIERSPRCITREQAALLARACRVRPVLVVEEMPPEEIAALVKVVGRGPVPRLAVQLHGGGAEYVREVAEALDAVPFGGAGLRSRPQSHDALAPEGSPHGDRPPSHASDVDTRVSSSTVTNGRERSPAPPNDQTTAPAVEIWRPIGLPERADDREALVEETLAEIEAALDAGASAIVLDTRTCDGTGGTGRTCDWEAAAEIVRRAEAPVLLAGGLSPENLHEALEVTGAAGADLSSSLEAAPGRKAPMRLRELAHAWCGGR